MEQRILAVDDEPHMLRLLERIITEKTPYRISTTSNSLMVPKMLEEEQYDLVITDLKMPGLDGLDLLRMIRENGRNEELIIITAFGSLDSAIEAMSQGVFDYITKPFKKEQILFTIDRAMRWQKLKQESRAMHAILVAEPYERAEREFRTQYVRNLAERSGNSVEEVAAASGLHVDVVRTILEEETE